MRQLDLKHHIDGDKLFKSTNGEEILPDEPVILFRARDHLSIRLLIAYRTMCEEDGCLPQHMLSLDEMIRRFSQFAHQHPERMKQPGVTNGA